MDGFSGFAHAVCVSDDSHYGVVFYQAGNAEPEGVCYQVAGLLRGYYFYVYRVGYGVGGDPGRVWCGSVCGQSLGQFVDYCDFCGFCAGVVWAV